MTRPINPEDRRILLASASPRRRALLAQLGIEAVVRPQSLPEYPDPSESPTAYTRRLAREKGESLRNALSADERQSGPQWILAADTVVSLKGVIYEKPNDIKHSQLQLNELSGCAHTVTTSFWIGSVATEAPLSDLVSVQTRVRFRDLDPDEVERYVATGEPADKAGSYGIQGIGGMLIAGIEGSYTNVVGLPISEVVSSLRGLGAIESFPFGGTASA